MESVEEGVMEWGGVVGFSPQNDVGISSVEIRSVEMTCHCLYPDLGKGSVLPYQGLKQH